MDADRQRRYAGADAPVVPEPSMRMSATRLVACAAAMLAVAGGCLAQAVVVPKVIHIVVPFSPGASNDVVARALAGPLARRLDTTVVVENKPGAAGVIGADAVAKAPRDGSVLLLTSSSFLTAAATQPTVPYDAATAFAPVAMIGQGPLVLAVSSSTPYRTPAELLAAARAQPDVLNYGTAGIGSIGHLATELFDDAAKIRMKHVPYKGAANAAVDLAGGQIQVMISSYSTLAPLIKAGKVRPLAVTSREAHPAFADLPPLAAAVPGFAIDLWVGVLAPAGTPAALVERLNGEIVDIAASPEMAVVLEPDGTVPSRIGPAAFATRVRDELAQWKRVAGERKIVAE
jgi:tripartite-type tricarboxylate transporter receptor subunit TctC